MDKKKFDELRLSQVELNMKASADLEEQVKADLEKAQDCCGDKPSCCQHINDIISKASQNETNAINIRRHDEN